MEGIRGIQHPLQTPIVLECIFNNLNIHDLQQCREVCRTWRNESGIAMKALAEVKIQCNEGSPKGPSEFFKLVQSDNSAFFQAPFADTFTVNYGVADCPEFWETCGVYIKYLRLSNVTFSSDDTFRHAIFECCPNLEKLELDDVEVVVDKPGPVPEATEWVAPQFTPNRNLKSLSFSGIRNELNVDRLEILSQFPCLEKLHAFGIWGQFVNVFPALEIARQHDTSCWILNEVTLWGGVFQSNVPPSFARVFGEGGFPLTSLSIQGITSDTENVTTVQKILVAHAHSLKRLEIRHNRGELVEKDFFPLPRNKVLEKLQALKLMGVKIRSTRFLGAFPNLKTLSLDVDEIPEDTQTPHVTLNDCTKLIFHNRISQTDDFKRLFGLLPNLRKLKVHSLENEQFSMICWNWPDLTHLELGGYGYPRLNVDDAGISGFDSEDVMKINIRGRRGFWRPITVRRANLSSLKNLRSFVWRINFRAYLKVGYCSKASGILELPNLQHLRVEREEEFTGNGFQEVFESLSEQFPWDDSQRITFD